MTAGELALGVLAVVAGTVLTVYTVLTYRRLGRMREQRQRSDRLQKEALLTTLLDGPRYRDPRHLSRFETQVYSQHGEDGIISEMLRRVGETNRQFVEIGAGDGRENNTAYRLSLGWSGHWFEGDAGSLERIAQRFPLELESRRLRAVHAWMTAENAADIMRGHAVPAEFDLLSLDIDRNTSHLWRALAHLSPRIVVIEYNASIPRDDEWEVEYEAEAPWDRSLYFGASLKSLHTVGEALGYVLVGCELSGTNAFFVRRDLMNDQFVGPFSAAACYEPPRYYLTGDRGHMRRYGRSAHARQSR